MLTIACLPRPRCGTSLETMATRCAKRQVEMLSLTCSAAALTVATMTVRQLPPRLSRSVVVIMLFLYGTCARACPALRSCRPCTGGRLWS